MVMGNRLLEEIHFPCKGCKNRTPGCHSSCEEYLEIKAKYDTEKAKQLDYQKQNYIVEEYKIKGILKSKEIINKDRRRGRK